MLFSDRNKLTQHFYLNINQPLYIFCDGLIIFQRYHDEAVDIVVTHE